MVKSLRILTVAIVVILVAISFFSSPAFADQTSAQTAISSAQNSLTNCYNAAEKAEASGANITSLMTTFNSASTLLSDAQLAYATNNYDSAYNYASQCQSELNGFTAQASSLQQSAVSYSDQKSTFDILSVLGSIAILCVGLVAWVVLNKQGRKKVNGRPTV